MQLKFNVNEQTLSLVSKQQVVADSLNYLTCKFSFSEEWLGVSKTAVFISSTEAVYTAVLDADNTCEVPWEVIEFPAFRASVYGGNRITTNMITVNVTESGYFEGDTSEEPSPSVYTQIMESIAEQNREISDMGLATASTIEGTSITVTDAEAMSIRGLHLYGKSTVNSQNIVNVADDGEIDVYVRGKNLFDVDKFVELVKSYDNTAIEMVENGRHCLKFNIATLYHHSFTEAFKFEKDKIYTWSMDIKSESDLINGHFWFGYLYNDEIAENITVNNTPDGIDDINRYFKANGSGYTKFTSVSLTSTNIAPLNGIAFSHGATCNWFIDLDSIQIEEGTVMTDAVPYEGQDVTVTTNALRGVPVSEGGNYIDESGQQWISDEADLVKFRHIQRIGKIDSYAGEDITTPYLSTTGDLSTGATVLYVLPEPVVTVLSVSSYDKLKAYNPVTHVFNRDNARMSMYYSPTTSLLEAIYKHQRNPVLDHPDGSVTKPKLANDVINWITGLVRGATDFTGTLNPPSMMDSYIFPNDKGNLQIYRAEEDPGVSGGGILLVTGTTDYEFNTLTNITQTYITCFGEVKTRKAESWDVTTGAVSLWSEWKSVYTTVDDTATLSNCVETMAQEISENTLKINNILATDEAEYKTVESNKLILRSSTEGSTKKFALTVDDSGTINVSEFLDKTIDDTEIEFE